MIPIAPWCMAMQLCHSKTKAEKLLISAFKKIHKENICREKYPLLS